MSKEDRKEELKKKAKDSKEVLTTLFAGALSIMFTQMIVTILNEKLKEINVWGIDSLYFGAGVVGSLLLLLVWFGIIKQKRD